jgi:hypothetical protein
MNNVNHLKKYAKYLKRNININYQFGSSLIPKYYHDDNTFLNSWKNIVQHGQQNCGIFVSDEYPDKIMKCEISLNETKYEEYNDLTKKLLMENIRISPIFHEIHIFNNQIYTIMDKLDGDLTKLIYEELLKYIIGNMNITEEKKREIMWFFNHKTEKTSHGSEYQNVIVMDYFVKLFENSKMKTYELCKKKQSNTIMEDENKLLLSLGFNDEKSISDFIKLVELVEIVKQFQITSNEYFSFINLFETEMVKLLKIIKDQIFMIHDTLKKHGCTYGDYKLDNYGYILKDTNELHMNINWKNNKIFNEKYLFVYFLDPSSGFSCGYKINDIFIVDHYNSHLLNLSRFGQYPLNKLTVPLIISKYSFCGYCYNFLGINKDLFEIIVSKQNTNFYINDGKNDGKNYGEIIAKIYANNKEIVEEKKQQNITLEKDKIDSEILRALDVLANL